MKKKKINKKGSSSAAKKTKKRYSKHTNQNLKNIKGSIVGVVDMTNMGYAFVVSEESKEDIFITERNLHSALHGDKVRIQLFAGRKKNRQEGEVIQIIERSRSTFVGVVDILSDFAFLIPDSKNMPLDIFIPLDKLNGATQGIKAIAKIVDWDTRNRNPKGEIVEILGVPGENETEMHAILAEFQLPYKFTSEVEAAAININGNIDADEICSRRDFRKVTTFTIDPADAKDFDDALSLDKRDNGNWEIGIHIADVTHYIKPDTILDNEAYRRGTSIYLVDRTVPMLPERLSNDLCSLTAGTDKLTFSAVFEIDNQANIINEWFGRTIINSNRRFSYNEVQTIIDSGEGELCDTLLTLNNIAQTLRKQRFASGAISFERQEVKFELDEKGKPLGVHFREQGTAHQLVEEFMLLANRSVAEYIGKKLKGDAFVYRIHDKPNQEKLIEFSEFISRYKYKLNVTEKAPQPKTFNKILSAVIGSKEQNIITTLALRTMAKAIYSTKNIGHYGLAFRYYTHFTSPIRRYPDMMVHRLLSDYLDGKQRESKDKYEKMCMHASGMEKLAADAERASIKYKQVEYMSRFIEQEFDAIISGVTEYGIFVEVKDCLCEGLVSTRTLGNEYFEYIEDEYSLKGHSSGKVYTLGNEIKVRLVKTDLEKKQLDFVVVQ